MNLTSRPYSGEQDLFQIRSALAAWTAAADPCVYLHVGDIPHRIYNGIRGRAPLEQMVRTWWIGTDLVALVAVYPYHDGYDALVHPNHRGGELELETLIWGGVTTREAMDAIGRTDRPVITDVFDGDDLRVTLLERLGYERGEHYLTLTEQILGGTAEGSLIKNGFSIRSAAGLHEAGALAEVHHGAFGSDWTADLYREAVMTKPGYDINRELVFVAPDGRFAAFCIYWIDERNGIGYFEPVGTHADFRRQGLASALMQHAMRIMREIGLRRARVMYAVQNEASSRFYASLGFRDICQLYSYALPV